MDKGIVSLVAMLNKNGKGKVYFGVANDGEVLGLKGTLGCETVKKNEIAVARERLVLSL